MERHITLPLTEELAQSLHAGDTVYLTGTIYTSRDAGHKPEVVEAMKKYSGVYFGAIGGAGALLAKCVKECELIAYEDLGAEALRRLYVEDMPLFVIIDCQGNNLYESGRQEYLRHHGEERAE